MSQDLIKSIEKLIENGNVSSRVSSIAIGALPIIRQSRLQTTTESIVDTRRIFSIYSMRKKALAEAGIVALGLDETLQALEEEKNDVRLISCENDEYNTVVFCSLDMESIVGIFYFKNSKKSHHPATTNPGKYREKGNGKEKGKGKK